MKRCRTCRLHLPTFLLLLGGFSAAAGAQTTQPAPGWQEMVERLSVAVRGKDLDALRRVLDGGPIIRTFTSDMLQPPERLLGATTGGKVLGQHAYSNLPSTLASDLSADFAAADVPEAVRSDFVIPDETAERDSNEIAARWIAQALRPAHDSPVAVIVLWRQDRSDSFSHAAAKRALFLLVKGELLEDQYIIRQITYGDPLERQR